MRQGGREGGREEGNGERVRVKLWITNASRGREGGGRKEWKGKRGGEEGTWKWKMAGPGSVEPVSGL